MVTRIAILPITAALTAGPRQRTTKPVVAPTAPCTPASSTRSLLAASVIMPPLVVMLLVTATKYRDRSATPSARPVILPSMQT